MLRRRDEAIASHAVVPGSIPDMEKSLRTQQREEFEYLRMCCVSSGIESEQWLVAQTDDLSPLPADKSK